MTRTNNTSLEYRKVFKHKHTGSKVRLVCRAICAGTGANCAVVENAQTDSDLLVMTEVFFNSWYEEVPAQKPMYSLHPDKED